MANKQGKSSPANTQAEEDPLVAIARIRAQEQKEIAEDLKQMQEREKEHMKKMRDMQREHANKLDAIRKRRRW